MNWDGRRSKRYSELAERSGKGRQRHGYSFYAGARRRIGQVVGREGIGSAGRVAEPGGLGAELLGGALLVVGLGQPLLVLALGLLLSRSACWSSASGLRR